MKQILFLTAFVVASIIPGFSQGPDAFNYQAVVRNSSGEIISNQNVSFRISILQNSENGTPVYVETQSAQTNQFGLISLKIGEGTVVSGSFDPSAWGFQSHFIKIEMDDAGGSAYAEIGTSPLLAVPFAFHAKTVENDQVDDADADATNELQTLSISGTQLTLSDGGGTVTLPSSGGGDNWGTQTVESDATLDGNGTSSSPLSVVGDLTDNQTLSISGSELSITGGNSVTLPSGTVSPWLSNSSNIYFNSGNVGIGTSDPTHLLDIIGTNSYVNLKANSNAALVIDRGSYSSYSTVNFMDQGENKYWAGMAPNSDRFRISTLPNTLQGLEVDILGSVHLSEDLFLNEGKNISIGVSNPYYPLEIKGGDIGCMKFFSSASGTGPSDGFLIGLYASDHTATISNHEYGPIVFSTNSTNRMTISATGKVSIGPVDPISTLNIHSGISAPGIRLLDNSSGSTAYDGLLLGFNTAGAYLHYYENKPLRFSTNNEYRMTIAANGYLGIGTTSPSDLVTIDGQDSSPWMRFVNNFWGKTENDGLHIGLNSMGTYFFNLESSPIFFGTSNEYRMTVAANGYIGIGTTTPSAGLHLRGTGFPSSFMYITADAGQDAGFRLYESSTAKWHIFNNATADGLHIYNSAASTAIFAKQSNSYVGIRTTTPAYALHVNGDAAKTTGSTTWIISSDRRLKDINGNYNKGLAEIMALQPIRYNYKKDNPRQLPSDKEQVGFIAQDVQKVFPEAVSEREDGYLDFDIHPINVAYVNAIKELKAENEELVTKVKDLESRLKKLEFMLSGSASK